MEWFFKLTELVESLDPEILAGGIIFYAVVLTLIVAFTVSRYLLTAIGCSRMYQKAGISAWKAFIPVYHTYNNFKISWTGKMFFLYTVLYILFIVFGNSTMISLRLASMAAGIFLIVIGVTQSMKMAKAFGKGTGTGIALIFFPGITDMILGLGKAEYQGAVIENN